MSTPATDVQLPGQLPGVGNAAQGSQSALGQLGQFNTFGQYLPQAEGVTQGLFNNPYAGGVQSSANMFSPMAMGGGMNTFQAGNNLYGGGNALMNNAFDPQMALYNRTAQQVQDQTRTAEAARGIATTPYGAGIEGQTMSNFNIDWQNNELQRMLSGLSGAGQGYGQASQMQQQAPVQFMQGAQLPYSTFGMLGGNQLSALQGGGQFGQSAAQLPQWMQNQQQGYALGGQQQNIGQANLGLNQANLGWQEAMAPWQLAGQVLGAGGAGAGRAAGAGMF